MITSTSALVERNMTRTRVLSCRPAIRCPKHTDTVLDGGPVQYRCPKGHRVQAAGLEQEVTR
jgi:hypothetical protein